ncbi:MAG TPA: KUP/HAK/KT family potassium transporter [Verrucomicrobiales bacterium]|nr:KUP/HAK/KT family potassium transporter [Verrucomicrobiales bacterium]
MENSHQSSNWTLTLMALGVVFGDIGTSPLYALRECLSHSGYTPGRDGVEMVYGPISLMFWSLTIMVSIKYLSILCQATAQGEGGMFALLSLLRSKKEAFSPRSSAFIVLIVLFGASLLYGDGMITPAISVLSAVEGLKQLNDDLSQRVVMAVSVVILLSLFLVQRHGTAKIGVAFGPIMILWFLTLGSLGLYRFLEHPEVITALSPHWGIGYLAHHGQYGIVIMGMVLLAVTGCEAMYADIGHFGPKPLKKSWFRLVYPALILNYLGQGALVISDPEATAQPFFKLVPEGLLIPIIVLATAATIIASQAMITGVFSLTQQAVQLGYMPRLKIIHTNPDVRGQIYMPQVNHMLMIACIALVIGFQTSSNLASAYGLSVSMEMFLTSILFFFVARRIWEWPLWKALLPVMIFATIEFGYVAGSMSKFKEGAWFPVVVASGVWIIMKTWTDGRTILFQAMQKGRLPVKHLVDDIKNDRIIRVPGTAVFMSATADGVPLALLHHLKHNKALHQQVVLLTVNFENVPYVPRAERNEISEYYDEFYRVILRYGFAESPNVFDDLFNALKEKTKLRRNDITFYQSREVLLTNGPGKMAGWRKKLFVLLSRISRPATGYFDLPPRQVIELGIQLEV